jgi:hypothetical protein
MKAYIIKIELEDSNPLIWRRVIMPAGATYKRLHDVIQNATNFQSGYPYGGYHLYEFDLTDKIVTDDEEAYQEHQHYVKNRKYYEERLKSISSDMLQFEQNYQERLKIEVRKPTGLKIDDHLEKYKEIRYNYDFGDNWWFVIKLEEIVDDYYFGFPTLLDGAETAPPEDGGGIHGFYEFLEVYRDEDDPEHEDMKTWAESLEFREYEPDWINVRLKGVEYKKTEWDKIKHEYYKIIEDKYRKSGCNNHQGQFFLI